MFLIIAIIVLSLYIIFIVGPSFRFLSMLTPFIVLACALFLAYMRSKFSHSVRQVFIYVFFGIFLVFEVSYSINSQILNYPYGREVWAYSPVNEERYPWGYNELGNYFTRELDGKMPAQVFDMRYKFLDALHDRTVKENLAKKLPRYSAIIIYDANMQKMAQLWVLDRLNIYHAWPVVNTEQYLTYLRDNGVSNITQDSFEHHYFVRATDNIWLLSPENRSQIAAQFEQELLRINIMPEKIYNKKGEEAFRIYKF